MLHRGDLDEDDVAAGIATSRELTLTQCLRQLPDDEALVIADSALRHGEEATLRRVATTIRGPGSAKVRRIAAAARPEAANAFESHEWHSGRASLRKDVRRYSLLVADDWRVLRFIWEDVMFKPQWVREVMVRTASLVNTRTQLDDCPSAAA